jgi:hypothetical protein
MTRYFFDLGDQHRCLYDFSGREFATLEAASELAHLMALDLELEREWIGWEVAVRDARGGKRFSVPVRNTELFDG